MYNTAVRGHGKLRSESRYSKMTAFIIMDPICLRLDKLKKTPDFGKVLLVIRTITGKK